MAFDKKALFAAMKPKVQHVTVEGFGEVGVAQLTVAEVESLRAKLIKNDQKDEFGLNLVLHSVVDEAGLRVFDDADISALQGSSNAAMDNLVMKALEANGFKKAAEAKN